MPLQIKHGDLFEHAEKECVIAHGCNAQGKMNSGFAKEIRQRYPLAFMSYILDFKDNQLVLGETTFVNCENSVVIANCITQQYYGREPGVVYADIKAIKKCIIEVAKFCIKANKPLHIPLIGGGLGGLKKDDLIPIFKQYLEDNSAYLWLKE